MAKKFGYRSRSVYKLKQLDERFGILKDAKNVLDLGAAPGGWLQVVAEKIGGDGFVLGVDLKQIERLDSKNVETIIGDVTSPNIIEKIEEKFSGAFDLVLSDLSPNISGVWELDHVRQIDLSARAMEIALKVLDPKGWMVLKVFQGSEFNRFLEEARRNFKHVWVFKPKASRKESAEVYIAANGLKRKRVS
ncbi:MAG: RlmE family RNA methyltransferase [Candidatus Bathyarchaeia archaeon]